MPLTLVTASSTVVARALPITSVPTAGLFDASKINPELVEGLEPLIFFVVALGATTFNTASCTELVEVSGRFF